MSIRDKALIVLGTVINVVVIGYALAVPPQAEEIAAFGLLGIFVATLINGATLFSPIPAFLATFVAARFLPIAPLIVLSAIAATLGESIDYFFGDGLEDLVKDNKWHAKLKEWFHKYPFIFLVIWVALPNPLQTFGQVFAGTANYPFWKYMIAVLLGNLIWYSMVALTGSWLLNLEA